MGSGPQRPGVAVALWRAWVLPRAARRRGCAEASATLSPRPCSGRPAWPAPRARTAAWTRSCGGICRPEVYDAIRAYEPCIVVPDTGKHTLKYVVLSDLLIYLTENPPQSIRRVVALRHIVAIDLVRRAGGLARTPLLGAPNPSCTREGGPSSPRPGLQYSL